MWQKRDVTKEEVWQNMMNYIDECEQKKQKFWTEN